MRCLSSVLLSSFTRPVLGRFRTGSDFFQLLDLQRDKYFSPTQPQFNPSTPSLLPSGITDNLIHSPLTYTMAATAPPTSTGSTKLDAGIQKAAAHEPQKLSGINLYSRFAFAGAVCCSVTHGGLTPVDV